jgi:uncharacterized membrane protein YeaQ/YmgE (transglycosylase-associated protein family)
MTLEPGGLLAWIVVGLIAGWAAGKFVEGTGLGLIGDLVVGLLGALIGGILIGFFIQGSVGLIGSTIVAFAGAVVLLFIVRALTGGRRRRVF